MQEAYRGDASQPREHDAIQLEADTQMQVPHKRLLTPMVAPPSVGLGAGSWHWLTPRDIIPALPVEHEMHIEFALWVELVNMESGEKAVEVATAPGTRRCFWLGQEAEQARGTEETDEEVDEEDDEDSDEQPTPAGNFEARTVTVTPRVAEAQAGGATQPTRKKSIPAHVGDYPWLRCFAPGHPMTQTEAPRRPN